MKARIAAAALVAVLVGVQPLVAQRRQDPPPQKLPGQAQVARAQAARADSLKRDSVKALTPAKNARQQASGTGSGMALSGGAGIGWTRPACDFCRRHLDAGPALYLQMTSQVNPRLALGAEADLWARDNEVFVLNGALSFVAQLRKHPESPFFLKGGIGYMTYRAYDDSGDLVSNMPAIQMGAGYRFMLSSGFAINNYATLFAARFGKLREDGDVVVDNFGVMSLQLGLGVTRF